MLVERHRRVARGLVGEALEAIDFSCGWSVRSSKRSAVSPRAGRHREPEAGAVRIVADDERGVLRAEEVRPARPRHARHREVRRQPAGAALLVRDHRAQARMEADERAAADGNARRGAGHHVVVARAVVALVVADRADHRELVEAAASFVMCSEKKHARHGGRDRP